MTTHEETIDAVILHQAPYKESGALIVIYSREFGKLSLIAQGVKKLTSKNAPSVLPLTLSELTIIPRSGLSRLIRGQAKRYYLHIKEHIQYEITASYLLEYYYRYEEENDPSEEAYQFLVAALEALEN
ncbi:MAG: DNA repair protein RecO, partial [bacterium]